MGKKDRALRLLNYHARQKGWVLLFGMTFLLGVFLGTRIYALCRAEERQLLEALLQHPQHSTFATLFRRQLLQELLLLFLLFLSGFCAIGQITTIFLLLFRGLGIGISAVFLAQLGREGFQHYLLSYLPPVLIFLMLQLIASRETANFSMNFLRQLIGSSSARVWNITPRVYVLRFILLILLYIVAAFLVSLLALFVARFQ